MRKYILTPLLVFIAFQASASGLFSHGGAATISSPPIVTPTNTPSGLFTRKNCTTFNFDVVDKSRADFANWSYSCGHGSYMAGGTTSSGTKNELLQITCCVAGAE